MDSKPRSDAASLPSSQGLLKNIGALFSGTVAARLLSMVTVIIITRSVGPQQFGLYAACLALAKITSVFFSLGLDGWLLRIANADRQARGIQERLSSSLLIQLILGLIWLILMGGVGSLLDGHVYPVDLLLISAATVWLEELAYTGWAAFKATMNNRTTLWLMLLFHLSVLLVVQAQMFLGVQAVLPFAIGRALATGVGTALVLWVTYRHFGISTRWTAIRTALSESIPFALSMVLTLIYGRADVVIVANQLGSEAAGLYAPAVALVLALALAPAALYGVMLPALSRVHAEDSQALVGLTKRMMGWSLLLGLALALPLVLLANPLVQLLYGPGYELSGTLAEILSGVLFVRTLSFGLAAAVVAVGLQKQRVIVQALAALFNIAANLLIVGQYGITGVAIVYCASEVVLMAGYALLLIRWQRRRNHPNPRATP